MIVEKSHVLAAGDTTQRLTLRYETDDIRGFTFHDLVVESEKDAGWSRDQTIWQGQAILEGGQRRWVSTLHSFDPDDRTAIIQIATQSNTDKAGSIPIHYAWVRWDVDQNRLVEFLQDCESPFDPFERAQT